MFSQAITALTGKEFFKQEFHNSARPGAAMFLFDNISPRKLETIGQRQQLDKKFLDLREYTSKGESGKACS